MRRGQAALIGLAISLGAACGGGGGDGRPQVVAAFYPLFEAAQRVGGNLVQVRNLTPAGSEPHDLELNSRQVDQIEDAAVVLFLGRGFQPALEKAAERAKGAKVDVLSALANLRPAGGGDDRLDVDPHVWLDPRLLKTIVGEVAGALTAADPANRATYESNAGAFTRELDDLDAAFTAGLATCDRRVIVTAHAAFGYLASSYGLTQEAIAGLEPESEPTPQRLADLARKVRADGTTTIFYETLVSPKVAESLAREAGVRTAVLDPLEGLTDNDTKTGRTYVSGMRENLAALRQALGCR
ncbi:MAG TPA: metal ABC transporter substrate-binding protein [Acidimicrobiales bacterium]|nr:metal ABC transporter substrate-binding protein [Acidimicrobiales bacterium]